MLKQLFEKILEIDTNEYLEINNNESTRFAILNSTNDNEDDQLF